MSTKLEEQPVAPQAATENTRLLGRNSGSKAFTQSFHNSSYVRSKASGKGKDGEAATNKDLVPEPPRGTKLYIIACTLCFSAAFFRALSLAASQILDNSVPEFELNIGRFGSMYLVVLPIYCYKRCPSMLVAPKQIVPIIMMSLMYFAMNLTTYAAAAYIAVGTSNVIIIISFMIIILLTSIVNSCLSKSKWQWRPIILDTAAILLLSVGVIFIIQPTALFGGSNKFVIYKSYCNPNRFGNMTAYAIMMNSPQPPAGFVPENHTSIADNKTCVNYNSPGINSTFDSCITVPFQKVVVPSWKGYVYSFAAGAFNSFRITIAKRIFRTEDNHVVAMWMASFNTVLSIICTAIFQSFTLPNGPFCIFCLFAHATTTGTMTILIITAMKNIPSTDLSLMHSFTPLFLFIFQFTFLASTSPTPSPQNALAIGSALFMSVVIIGKPVYEILYHRIQKKKQEKLRAAQGSR